MKVDREDKLLELLQQLIDIVKGHQEMINNLTKAVRELQETYL